MPGRKRSCCIYLNEHEPQDLWRLSLSQAAPLSEVLRARIILLSSGHPEWTIGQRADEAGGKRSPVIKFRQRWVFAGSIKDQPRPGSPRIYPENVRAMTPALACSRPKDHGKPWQAARDHHAASRMGSSCNLFMFGYTPVPHLLEAMCRSLAATGISVECPSGKLPTTLVLHCRSASSSCGNRTGSALSSL